MKIFRSLRTWPKLSLPINPSMPAPNSERNYVDVKQPHTIRSAKSVTSNDRLHGANPANQSHPGTRNIHAVIKHVLSSSLRSGLHRIDSAKKSPGF